MDDNQFRMLLEYLDYSWSGYRKVRKGVKKHIRRHMQQLHCRDISAYLKVLDRQPDRRQECELLMTVSISRFFRDRRLWEMLESRKDPKRFVIRDELKTNVHWKIHDLLTVPPETDFSVIFLRNNVLTYCRQETRAKVVISVLDGLAPGGLFVIGCHETLPFKPDGLISMDRFPFVFYKQP